MTQPVMSLDGKRVVVIGGGTGIGFAVASLAQELGASVLIASSQAVNVEAAVGKLPGATGEFVDVRDEASVARLFETVGPFDHLAFTAGDWGGRNFGATQDLDLVAARRGLDVRFWGAVCAVKYAVRTIAEDGSITLTSGMLAHRPRKGTPLTTAFAGAGEHLVRGLAVDLAPVRVNGVCPGVIFTDIVKRMPEDLVKAFVAPLPTPRAGTPEEAAMAYVYAMMNGYVTGQIIPVDGGGHLV